MTAKPVRITDLTFFRLEKLVAGLGAPAYRARQVQHWVYSGLAQSFDEMANLPKELRRKLDRVARPHTIVPSYEAVSSDGTVKMLFTLDDGKTVEAALMRQSASGGRHRYTVCASTQVGCPIGCAFCATGRQGYERNLMPGEIIDQVLYFARRLRDEDGSTVDNAVFMGMGEPLLNFDALWQAVETLNSADGFNLGARHITISTVGIVPGIRRLMKQRLQVGLAVSLHAADDALRDRLVPINRKYPLEKLMPACRDYVEATGRRVSFEYALFEGVNDSIEQARDLCRLLKGLNCHVNLIACNPTGGGEFSPPEREAVLAFQGELKQRHIPCTLRVRRGIDIDAGCGQLRSRVRG
ncbi:MAG: 23S rRNA (adenine(2503)-C(2))-methyltransferase RlmN [Chloroflexota bacterium]|nr:23S rRNA (adenine(2503)-C(2))-methyltransferase RlmN [Chloroflexota bacterium]